MQSMIDPTQSVTVVDNDALRRFVPRVQRTALAVGAGVLTAVVIGLASGIAGHWG